MSVAVFRCESLGARLTVASCASNHRAANADTSTMRPGQRVAIAARLHALGPCRGCAIGAEHAATGQPHPRVLVESITSRATPKAAPAPVQLPDFLRPRDAAPAPVPNRIPTGDSMPETLSPDAARLRELSDALRDAVAARTSRSWPAEAKALACAYRLAGASLVEVEAIGIHRRTLRDWMAEAGHELRRTGRPKGSKNAPKPRGEAEAPKAAPMPAALRVEPANDNGLATTEGRKDDAEKPRWDLVPHRAMADVVDVLTYGANKYGDDNWLQVPEPDRRYYAAAMRHLHAWVMGEETDAESGLPHLSHAITSLLFVLELEAEGE